MALQGKEIKNGESIDVLYVNPNADFSVLDELEGATEMPGYQLYGIDMSGGHDSGPLAYIKKNSTR